MSDGRILEMYTAYLAACNNRDWETIAGFVHFSVLVNGIQRTREQYVDDIRKTTTVFPDYAWELRHTVEQPPWLAVHLHDTGTRHQPFLGAPGDLSPVEGPAGDFAFDDAGGWRGVVAAVAGVRGSQPACA